jgi:hypothetical protein
VRRLFDINQSVPALASAYWALARESVKRGCGRHACMRWR